MSKEVSDLIAEIEDAVIEVLESSDFFIEKIEARLDDAVYSLLKESGHPMKLTVALCEVTLAKTKKEEKPSGVLN